MGRAALLSRQSDRQDDAPAQAHSDYFNTIPHGDLLRCVARRVTDGTVLATLRQWLDAPVVERADGRYSDEEMAEVLRFVDTIGVLACISRESISGRPIEPFTKTFDDVQHGRF